MIAELKEELESARQFAVRSREIVAAFERENREKQREIDSHISSLLESFAMETELNTGTVSTFQPRGISIVLALPGHLRCAQDLHLRQDRAHHLA